MASGHVNRINRPNTWLHRPMLRIVKKVLANSEPMVWTPARPAGRMSTWTAARENHHAGRSDRLGLGKVRV